MTANSPPTEKTDDFDALGCLLTFALFLGLGIGTVAAIVFALRCAWEAGA